MSHSVTEKRTIIKSSTSGGGYVNDDPVSIQYKSTVGPRSNSSTTSTVKSRSSFTPSYVSQRPGSGYSYQASYSYGLGSVPTGLGSTNYTNITNTAATNVKSNREKEKKDMQDLNERLANYIEKVRFLEAQNKKLANELDDLKGKWGKETAAIKSMYETELKEVRGVLDDTAKEKSRLEIEIRSLQEQNHDIQKQLDEAKRYRQIDRDQINKLNQQLAEYDGEISMLRRMLESLEKERERDKHTIQRITEEVEKLRLELNAETLAHLDVENRLQTLIEEMEFMRSVHEEEMKELANLAYRDTTAENREFWKNELGQAIRDIQQEYESKLDSIRGDMEGFYNLKIQEIRTGVTKQNMETQHSKEELKKWRNQVTELKGKLADMEARNAQLERTVYELQREQEESDRQHALREGELRDEINKLRIEMEKILHQIQTLMDAKLSLELEIAAYRKLLEGEESRVGLKNVVESMIQTRTTGGQSLSEVISSSGYGAESGGEQGETGPTLNVGEQEEKAPMLKVGEQEEKEPDVTALTDILRNSIGANHTEPKNPELNAPEIKAVEAKSVESKPKQPKDAKRVSKTLPDPSKTDSQMSMKMMRGEVSAKTTYQRTSKGAVAILEASPEGKFIALENSSTGSTRRDENMDGWKLIRTIDDQRDVKYEFPRNFILKCGEKIRIWARNNADQASHSDLVHRSEDNWGIGSKVVTKLVNANGDEKASHTQKTLYH